MIIQEGRYLVAAPIGGQVVALERSTCNVRSRTFVFSALACSIVLAGCGGGGGDTASSARVVQHSVKDVPNVGNSTYEQFSALADDSSAASSDLGEFNVVSNGRTIYVSNDGSDGNDGLDESEPMRSIQSAVDRAQPGDTVLVRGGYYSYDYSRGDVVSINNSGRADAWISLKGYPGEAPVIANANVSGIKVSASYVLVEGFVIEGTRDQVSYDEAQSEAWNMDNPKTSGIGIAVGVPWNNPGVHPTHIVIRGNEIIKNSGAGINTDKVDYVLIENNVISGNAYWSPYGNSGISMYQNWDTDGSDAYKFIVRGNLITDTFNKVASAFFGVISDGNGIIIDDGRHTQSLSGEQQGGTYRGRTLIDSNLIYGNGGRAVNIFSSDHVDVVNNTTYQNSIQEATPEGEIVISSASDIRVENNILVARDDRPVVTRYNSDSETIRNNLVSGGNGFDGDSDSNLVGMDPEFLNADENDFRVSDSSPAIDAGDWNLTFPRALFGAPRPLGDAPDIGAYEMR